MWGLVLVPVLSRGAARLGDKAPDDPLGTVGAERVHESASQ